MYKCYCGNPAKVDTKDGLKCWYCFCGKTGVDDETVPKERKFKRRLNVE